MRPVSPTSILLFAVDKTNSSRAVTEARIVSIDMFFNKMERFLCDSG